MKESSLKQAAFAALELSGALAVAERLARGVPILAYHGVTAGEAEKPAHRRRQHVPRAEFERHVKLLSSRFHPVALTDLVAGIERRTSLPRRAVVVTFDDGYRNFATQAWPVLRRHGVPATLFVLTHEPGRLWEDRLEARVLAAPAREVEWQDQTFDLARAAERARLLAALEAAAVGATADREQLLQQLSERLEVPPPEPDEDRDRLSWDELRHLCSEGLDVGSHADLHVPLTQRPQVEAAEGLRRSLAALARELGTERPALSYPYGARSAAVVAVARAAGFACAVTGVPALAGHGTDVFELPRFLVGADDDRPRLRASLAGLRRLWQGDPWPSA